MPLLLYSIAIKYEVLRRTDHLGECEEVVLGGFMRWFGRCQLPVLTRKDNFVLAIQTDTAYRLSSLLSVRCGSGGDG